MQLELVPLQGNTRIILRTFKEISEKVRSAKSLLAPLEQKNRVVLFDTYSAMFFIFDREAYDAIGAKYAGKVSIPFAKTWQRFTDISPVCTTHCNLNCTYCYAAGGVRKGKHSSWKLIKAGIDYVAKEGERVNVHFFPSGEQTINFPLLQKTILYAKKKLNPYVVKISTNGVIPKHQLLWLADNVTHLQISCDGPPEIQDLHRPTKAGGASSPCVEKSIKLLVGHGKNFHVKATLTATSVGNEEAIFKYFYELGVPLLIFSIIMPLGKGRKHARHLDLRKVIRCEFKIKELAENFGMRCETAADTWPGRKAIFTCGVGYTFALGTDGRVSGCAVYGDEYDLRLNKGAKELIFGRFDQRSGKFIIDKKKLRELRRFRYKVKRCSKCDFKLCWGDCPLRSYEAHGSIYIPNEWQCTKNKTEFFEFTRYLFEKHVVKLTPRLEKIGNDYWLAMQYSRFKISPHATGSTCEFIRFSNDESGYEKLLTKMKRSRSRAKRNLKIFLLSLGGWPILDFRETVVLKEFLYSLKQNRLLFLVTKPFKISDVSPQHEAHFYQEFRIPQSCFDCLEMFVVERGRARFCNGMLGPKLSEVFDRRELYEQFLASSNKKSPRCEAFNIFNMRSSTYWARSSSQAVRSTVTDGVC